VGDTTRASSEKENIMKNRIAALALATALLGGTAVAVAAAGPPGGTVPAHGHVVALPDGTSVQVGPDACSNGQSVQFDNFHNNVHRGAAGDNGIISFASC
jgi:hypothetical protein